MLCHYWPHFATTTLHYPVQQPLPSTLNQAHYPAHLSCPRSTLPFRDVLPFGRSNVPPVKEGSYVTQWSEPRTGPNGTPPEMPRILALPTRLSHFRRPSRIILLVTLFLVLEPLLHFRNNAVPRPTRDLDPPFYTGCLEPPLPPPSLKSKSLSSSAESPRPLSGHSVAHTACTCRQNPTRIATPSASPTSAAEHSHSSS